MSNKKTDSITRKSRGTSRPLSPWAALHAVHPLVLVVALLAATAVAYLVIWGDYEVSLHSGTVELKVRRASRG